MDLLDTLFKLDEGIIVMVVVAALTPIIAAPAGYFLDRTQSRREKAAAAKVAASGDGSNNAAMRQSGTGNTMSNHQSHSTTTINVVQGQGGSTSGNDEVWVFIGVAVVAMVTAIVAFLKVGALPMKIAGGISLGLTIGILIHLLRSSATPGARLKAFVCVVAATSLYASAYLMEAFSVRHASLATASAKVHGWHIFASWSDLRKIEQTIGYVFLLGTILGMFAAVTVAYYALGTALTEHQRRRGGPSPTSPRWEQRLTDLGIGFLATMLVLVTLATVVNSGLLTERIHRWTNDNSSVSRPGTDDLTTPRCAKKACNKLREEQPHSTEHT